MLFIASVLTALASTAPPPAEPAVDAQPPSTLVRVYSGVHTEKARQFAERNEGFYYVQRGGVGELFASSSAPPVQESVGTLPGVVIPTLPPGAPPTMTSSWTTTDDDTGGPIVISITSTKSNLESPNNWAWQHSNVVNSQVDDAPPTGAAPGASVNPSGQPVKTFTWTSHGGAVSHTLHVPKNPGESDTQWTARASDLLDAMLEKFPPDPAQDSTAYVRPPAILPYPVPLELLRASRAG